MKDNTAGWKISQGGLLVPSETTEKSQAIDIIRTYITMEEISSFDGGWDYILSELKKSNLDDVLINVAQVINLVRREEFGAVQVDEKACTAWFNGRTREIVSDLIKSHKRVLVVPQLWMILAKLACVHSKPGKVNGNTGNLVAVALTLPSQLERINVSDSDHTIRDKPGPVGRELVSNQLFNFKASLKNTLASFSRRWIQLPNELESSRLRVNVKETFERRTGVSLEDFITVAAALLARCVSGQVRVDPDYFSSLNWSDTRISKTLALFTKDSSALRESSRGELRPGKFNWSFSTFGRYPIIRLSDKSLLVIDQNLLVERVFGWLPFWDMVYGAEGSTNLSNKQKGDIADSLRYLAEEYVSEIFESMFPSLGDTLVYREEDLKIAFPEQGQKHVDVVVDCGTSLILAEITTTRFSQESYAGYSEDKICRDIDKYITKAKQIDKVIQRLRQEYWKLPGMTRRESLTFQPVIVAATGFPVNPITMTVVHYKLKQKGLLQGEDTAPLEILETEDLEMIESLQESGSETMQGILKKKSVSNLKYIPMRNYISNELGTPRSSTRIDEVYGAAFDVAIAELLKSQGEA